MNDNVCRCTSCGEVFVRSDAVSIVKNYYGIKVAEKVCPFCKRGKPSPINFAPKVAIERKNKKQN